MSWTVAEYLKAAEEGKLPRHEEVKCGRCGKVIPEEEDVHRIGPDPQDPSSEKESTEDRSGDTPNDR